MIKPILEFEQPLVQLEEKIAEMKELGKAIDLSKEIAELERRTEALRKEIYQNLTSWQRVQIARHPARPHTLDYLKNIFTDFIEIHGDRSSGDDTAIVGGLTKIKGLSVVVFGNRKTKDKKSNMYRPAAIPTVEGYRKIIKLLKFAERFEKPVISLVDVPYEIPSAEEEARGLAHFAGLCIKEMLQTRTPVLNIIIGEGGGLPAAAMVAGDRLLMLENAWFSIVSPEKAAEIHWGSSDFKEQAAEALKLTAADLKDLSLIDEVVAEPIGGAHRNHKMMFDILKNTISNELKELSREKIDKALKKRREKFYSIGVWKEND